MFKFKFFALLTALTLILFGVMTARADDTYVSYQISTGTGCMDGAGTDARVYITLHGTLGTAGPYELDRPAYNDFERCVINYFTLYGVPDVGYINRIYIRHDNSGNRPGWFLTSVSVKNMQSSLTWRAVPNRWLSLSDYPYSLSVSLSPQLMTPK